MGTAIRSIWPSFSLIASLTVLFGCSRHHDVKIAKLLIQEKPINRLQRYLFPLDVTLPQDVAIVLRQPAGCVSWEEALVQCENLEVSLVVRETTGQSHTYRLGRDLSANAALYSSPRSNGRFDPGWRLTNPKCRIVEIEMLIISGADGFAYPIEVELVKPREF